MDRLFAVLALLFVAGGGLVPLVVTGSFWPLICAVGALYWLSGVFTALGGAPPPAGHAARPPEYLNGRKDRRMPS